MSVFTNTWRLIGKHLSHIYQLHLLCIRYSNGSEMYLNGISHGLLPHPLPPTHLSAHTTLSAALGISQWAYPSLEVCADENRKKKRECGAMEKEEGRCEVKEMKREEGGEGEDVEPWSRWWMREKMQVDGCSPPSESWMWMWLKQEKCKHGTAGAKGHWRDYKRREEGAGMHV